MRDESEDEVERGDPDTPNREVLQSEKALFDELVDAITHKDYNIDEGDAASEIEKYIITAGQRAPFYRVGDF